MLEDLVISMSSLAGSTSYISIDGLRINLYDSAGERSYEDERSLIFLHGMPGQISNWKYQIKYFEERYRVIAYDQRGFGKSDKPKSVRLQDYLDDLDRIMARTGVKPENAVIIGHSFGGMIAQAYAREKAIRGLILVGSLTKIKPDIIDKITWYLPSVFWGRLFFHENPLTRRVYRDMFFSPSTPAEVFEEFLRDNKEYLESLPAHAFRYGKYFTDYDASKWLHEVRAPTLIVVGRDDKVTPPSESEKISRLIPNSKLIVVENAGHLILYERHEELNRLIEEFVQKL